MPKFKQAKSQGQKARFDKNYLVINGQKLHPKRAVDIDVNKAINMELESV